MGRVSTISIRQSGLHWLSLYVLLSLFLTASVSFSTTVTATAADRVEDNQPIDISGVNYQQLFTELITLYNFDQGGLQKLFTDIRIDKRVLQLMDTQWEAKPYYEYRPRFITASMIFRGKQKLRKHRKLLNKIETAFGVNREHIVAIWGIESRYGASQGSLSVFRTLNTLFAAYPRRSAFFRKELIQFLRLCQSNQLDPLEIKGSYAGAFGQAQFIPSSYLAYAVDFDNDGRVDLVNSVEDILASIANYLKVFGWILNAPVYADIGTSLSTKKLMDTYQEGRKGRINWRLVADLQKSPIPRPPLGGKLSIVGLKYSSLHTDSRRYFAGYPNFHAITEYNHSHKYAMVVTELAEAFIK